MTISTRNDTEKIRALKKNDPDINLYILLDQTNSLINNAVELEIKHLRMKQAQISVLTMLSREDRPVTLDELANWTLTSFNSVASLINRMERKGLIDKIKKDGDLKTYVVLTDKGSDLYHNKVTERSIHLVFEKLTNEEKNKLGSILRTLRDTTRDLMGLNFRPPFLP